MFITASLPLDGVYSHQFAEPSCPGAGWVQWEGDQYDRAAGMARTLQISYTAPPKFKPRRDLTASGIKIKTENHKSQQVNPSRAWRCAFSEVEVDSQYLSGTCNQHQEACSSIQQNHRILGGGRDPWRSSGPIPFYRSSPQQVTHGGWRRGNEGKSKRRRPRCIPLLRCWEHCRCYN